MIKIDQIAIAIPNLEFVMKNLKELGIDNWSEDEVVTNGIVYDQNAVGTEASLRFNYDLIPDKEFELIRYNVGDHWHSKRGGIGFSSPFISHLGMHVDTEEEFEAICTKMSEANYRIAQEVYTQSHTNEGIRNERRYRYVIFDSYARLGFDFKIILRLNLDGTIYIQQPDFGDGPEFKGWDERSREKTSWVLDEVMSERVQQAKKYGNDCDDNHTVQDFAEIICSYTRSAAGSAPDRDRQQLVRVAALAVAAVESIDRLNQS